MRFASFLGGVACVLAAGMVGHAQPPAPLGGGPVAERARLPYVAEVILAEAEVRSGPSAKMYATEKLPRGSRVEVVKVVDDDYLAIKPPPHAFSWVNTRFLKQTSPLTWTVDTEADSPAVPVRYGSWILMEQPSVAWSGLQKGTQLVALGNTVTGDGGVWLPIESPPNEIRYIRKGDVRSAVVSQPAPVVAGGFIAPPPAPRAADLRWSQAQDAEQRGDVQEALRLYRELALSTDFLVAQQSQSRIQFLSGSAVVPATPGRPVEGTLTSNPRWNPPAAAQDRSLSAYTNPSPPASAIPAFAETKKVYGYLRPTCYCINGAQSFGLSDTQGNLVMYVTPATGVNVAAHAGSYVVVEGSTIYHGYYRRNVMTVQRIDAWR